MSECDAPIWVPDKVETTRVFHFISHVNNLKNTKIASYKELWQWSVDNISDFWSIFLEYSKIKYSGKYERVVEESLPMSDVPKWFEGIELNYARNLMHPGVETLALVAGDESGNQVTFTHQQLYVEVSQLCHCFKMYGLQKGDIVTSNLPHDHRAIIAMLACTSLGCVWTSIPTELQAIGIQQKLEGMTPRIFLSTDKTVYEGKVHDQMPKLKQVVELIQCLEHIIIFPSTKTFSTDGHKFITENQLLERYGVMWTVDDTIDYVDVPFAHPLYILYTSGTTGPSKKLVHSVGGTLIKILSEHMLNWDMTKQDVMYFNTSPGWILWNWIVTTLFFGGTLLTYSGSPVKPDPYALWKFIDKNGVTIFGSGAAFYLYLQNFDISPKSKVSLSRLRYVLSTGSYLSAKSYHFINDHIKPSLPICSNYGASDAISFFAAHNLTLPVYPGEVQYPNWGVCCYFFNEEGKPVYDELGEFVVTKPFPSMPVYLLNDPDNKRYTNTYFKAFPGVWTQGDYGLINSKTGGLVISGRR